MNLVSKSKLIDIVRLNPALWRTNRKDQVMKKKLWNVVGLEFDTSGSDARRQWEVLRDQFRREYKRYTSDRTYVSRWIFYKRMLFVKHTFRSRDERCSTDEVNNCEEQHSLDVDSGRKVEKIRCTQPQVQYMPKIQVRQDLQATADRSPAQHTIREAVIVEPSTSGEVSSPSQCPAYDEINSSTSVGSIRCHVDKTEDEDYHFVMSILPSLRSIKSAKKLMVRLKIMELITKELDADSDIENQMLSTDSEVDEKFLLEEAFS